MQLLDVAFLVRLCRIGLLVICHDLDVGNVVFHFSASFPESAPCLLVSESRHTSVPCRRDSRNRRTSSPCRDSDDRHVSTRGRYASESQHISVPCRRDSASRHISALCQASFEPRVPDHMTEVYSRRHLFSFDFQPKVKLFSKSRTSKFLSA